MDETQDMSVSYYLVEAEDYINRCAGQPVILASKFDELAEQLVTVKEVKHSKEELLIIFKEQSKRFSACGANNSDTWGVLRKGPRTGWKYLEVLIIPPL